MAVLEEPTPTYLPQTEYQREIEEAFEDRDRSRSGGDRAPEHEFLLSAHFHNLIVGDILLYNTVIGITILIVLMYILQNFLFFYYCL